MITNETHPVMIDFKGRCDFTNESARTIEGARIICSRMLSARVEDVVAEPILSIATGQQIGWDTMLKTGSVQ